MKRRTAIQSLALVSGHALVPSVLTSFLSGCAGKDQTAYKPVFFSDEEYTTITAIIDVIIPATASRSASQVHTQVFLDDVFHQCMTPEQQAVLREGLKELLPGFEAAGDKLEYIADVDRRAFEGDETMAFFKTIKQYTMIGFFTSQEGETKAGNYVKIPGTYKPEIAADELTLNYGKTFLHY